ncbi:MAG: GrpB family protein [Bacillota bacterium]
MTWRVLVVDYNPEWPAMFEAEAAKIVDALGDNLVAIHHIGSTSVPGLKAKPIIDILSVVRDIAKVDERTPHMEALGYEGLGEFGLPGRRYFRKGGYAWTHHVHVSRDYGELKARLAQLHPEDATAYMDGKDAFVKAMERDALAWSRIN